jgi:hypothetical protein
MSNYKDIELKLKYYKEQILKQFIKKGIYANDQLIAKYINNIDLNLSIFKNYNKTVGEKFNVNEYNESIKNIYLDLTYLFNILNELAINEYNNLQNYIYSYLNEFSSIVETYKNRADYENNSTTLGETLLYQDNNFTISYDNSTTIYNLNDLEIEDGSTIACIANVNNINIDNVVFSLINNTTNEELRTSPYNLNNNLLIMPGDKTINEYEHLIEEEQNIVTPLAINIDTNISVNNKYIILGGKNKLLIEDESNQVSLIDVPNNSGSILIKEKSNINFYVKNGHTITFKFNKKPISTNFPIEEQTISIDKDIQYFHIECDEDFYLEISLNEGNIYAIKENGIINNNILYYTGLNLIRDFIVLEVLSGELHTYKVQLIIYNDNNNDIDLNNIVIKKIE